MSRYKNENTGAVITCSSRISGGDWVEIAEDKKEKANVSIRKSRGSRKSVEAAES